MVLVVNAEKKKKKQNKENSAKFRQQFWVVLENMRDPF